ncbi:MAG TPA: MFS transporter, partial [Rugosimonospora sp.]|nr:MFS transporter [Rugosimonospora sp.]
MPRVVRDPITWLTYGQLAAYGYFLYTVSPAIALLRDEQHVSSSVASLHGVAVAVGALIAGAGFPWFARRVGRGHAMWVGLAGMAAGIAGLCVFRPIAATVACTLVAATAGVALVAGVVATLGERHGPGGATVIAEANALAVAVGALAPLAIGASVAAGWTWRPAAAVLVVMCLGCAVVARVRGIRLPDGPDARARRSGSVGVRARDEVAGELSLPAGAGTRGSGRLPAGFWIAWALTSVTGSVEVSLNLWSGDVLRQHDGMSSGAAATAVSAILAGMFLGRVAGGRIALRVPAPR